MPKENHNIRAIETHRLLTEQRLAYLLQSAEGSVTVDKVKSLIFEAEAKDFNSYVTTMLSALNCFDIGNTDNASLQVIQDAWNHFSHRSLNGRCPLELARSKRRASRGSDRNAAT